MFSPFIHFHHIYPSTYFTRMHILIWLYDSFFWIHGLTLWYMLCKYVYAVSLHLWAPYKPISYRVRERRHHDYSALIQKYYIFWEKREGETLLLPWRGSRNTTYWETWEGHTNKTLSFILKILQNSRIKVDLRIWDIVLDLTALLFNCSRPK
jgi:hypothetical protein